MDKGIKNKFPEWCDSDERYSLCLSDDIDSLASCVILGAIKGYEIESFYNFNAIGSVENPTCCNSIAVDVDIALGRSWGNHLTEVDNVECANLNTIMGITRENYFKKYAGSTLLEIIGYYNYDISDLSEEALMILLAVDSSYFMFRNPKYEHIGKYWLVDVLELPLLYECINRHTQEEFNAIQVKYNLKSKIVLDDGYLKTELKLDELGELFNLSFLLPKNKFFKIQDFKNIGVNGYDFRMVKKKLLEKNIPVFSQAITSKDFIKLSY